MFILFGIFGFIFLVIILMILFRFVNVVETFGGRKKGPNSNSE